MKLTLTSVERVQQTSKKTGKPYTSLRIKAQEYGDKLISGFGRKDNDSWAVGQVVEGTVEEKGQYLNLIPSQGAGKADPADMTFIKETLNEIAFKVGIINNRTEKIAEKVGVTAPKTKVEYPTEEEKEIPF